uniref:Uncharacterized protein n=1 Tax=Panagrolaimus davidi TaxID=227884 RepID=A0A914QD34_9BILA
MSVGILAVGQTSEYQNIHNYLDMLIINTYMVVRSGLRCHIWTSTVISERLLKHLDVTDILISADLQRYQQYFMAGNTASIRFLTQCTNNTKFGSH